MKLEIIGDWFSTSGYGAHLRGLAKAAAKKHEVRITCNKPQGWEHNVDAEERKMLDANFLPDVTVAITMPGLWKRILSLNPKRFFGFLIWECDRIPKHWVDICNDERIEGILVPSQFSFNAARDSGVKEEKLHIVHHGFDPGIFKPLEGVQRMDDKFVFMYPKGWAKGKEDRGGFDLVLEAFVKEFQKDEPVRLMAKFNPAYIYPGWDPKQELAKLGHDMKNAPEVLMTHANLSHAQINELLNITDCVVVPTKGESFGMTMLEANAAGIPVITTDYGGQHEFACPAEWRLKTMLGPATDGIMYEGMNWGYASIDELRTNMRRAFELLHTDKFGDPHQRKASIREDCILASRPFTWEQSAKELLEALGEKEGEVSEGKEG